MPISFSSIPAGWKIPLYYVEVDASKAGLPSNVKPAMLVGHMIDTGTTKGVASPNIPIPVASQAQADYQFGKGSQLANMFRAYFANNWAGQVYGLPLAEGTKAAVGTIQVATAPTAAGTLHLYIGGYHVPVSVASDDLVGDVADSINTAINDDDDLPVKSTVSSDTVTVTCKGKGTYGNDIVMSDNYHGAIGGEIMPPGLTLTYTAIGANANAGTGVPDPATAITKLGETAVEYVCIPFTDSDNLTKWETEFGFSDTGRWGFIRQSFGHLFSAYRSDYDSDLLAFAGTRNCPQLSVMAIEPNAQSPVWEWAAAYTAKAARGLANDPARPLQTLHLEGILPARGEDRFNLPELNAMAGAGLATQRTTEDGIPMIARETTTYVKNLYGVSDDAYEVVTTPATLAQVLRNQRQAITSKFPRHKLADDNTRFGVGQAIVTPKIVKAELVAQYRIDEFNGLVENAQAFKDNLIVERDANDPNRLNVLYPPDLVNQLRVFAVLAQFRLQYNRGIDTQLLASGLTTI